MSGFVVADGTLHEVLPARLAHPSMQSAHRKGQEISSIESFDENDRALAKRNVKKRGANKKQRVSYKKNMSRHNRGKKRDGHDYDKKKKGGNSPGGKKMSSNSTKKKKSSPNSNKKKKSNNKKKSNSNSNNKNSSDKKKANSKKTTAKASKNDKSKKKDNDKKWYPKFDSIMCTSGGGRPLIGFNPMYYASSKQSCCVRHFSSMITECMMRSSGTSAVFMGAKPGAWGGSSWMGDAHQPSWGVGASRGGKSGKSEAKGISGATSSTTIIYMKKPEEETHEPTFIPTFSPTFTPTTMPTDLPTGIVRSISMTAM